jgi:probable rRNA maturation factor
MPKLLLTVQYASNTTDLPTQAEFRKWVKSALNLDAEITLRLVDETEGRTLNHDYRGKDYATNVLTFALAEEPHLMGDIVLCAPVVLREAREQNKTPAAHFAHLAVHGILHLRGYDHETEAQAELMETLETEIVTKLGYANPYLSGPYLSGTYHLKEETTDHG